jgi:hypothetical protein
MKVYEKTGALASGVFPLLTFAVATTYKPSHKSWVSVFTPNESN